MCRARDLWIDQIHNFLNEVDACVYNGIDVCVTRGKKCVFVYNMLMNNVSADTL